MVVRGVIQQVGVVLISDDPGTQLGKMHAQLVGAAGYRREVPQADALAAAVEAIGGKADAGDGVGRKLVEAMEAHHDLAADLLDMAADGEGQAGSTQGGMLRIPAGRGQRDGLIFLGDFAALKHGLVGAAGRWIDREHDHTGCCAVEPVDRHEVIDPQLDSQPSQCRFAHVPAARGHRQEMRLIHHQQVRIAVDYAAIERDVFLVRGVPVIPNEFVLAQRGLRGDAAAIDRGNLAVSEAAAQPFSVDVPKTIQRVFLNGLPRAGGRYAKAGRVDAVSHR